MAISGKKALAAVELRLEAVSETLRELGRPLCAGRQPSRRTVRRAW